MGFGQQPLVAKSDFSEDLGSFRETDQRAL